MTLLDSVSRLWLRPPGNHPVIDLYGLSDTPSILCYTVTILSCITCHPVSVKYQDSTSRQVGYTYKLYLKANWPVVNITDLTWSLLVKMGSLPVFNCRVGNISVGQAGNTYRQAVNRNQQGAYTTDKLETVRQAGFIFTAHGLSAYEFSLYIRRFSLRNASDYIWQLFNNRSLFFYFVF